MLFWTFNFKARLCGKICKCDVIIHKGYYVITSQCWSVLELEHQPGKKMFTSASTLGVKTSSDIEDFLVFSGGVVELAVGCVGITLGVVGTAIPGVGSTIG